MLSHRAKFERKFRAARPQAAWISPLGIGRSRGSARVLAKRPSAAPLPGAARTSLQWTDDRGTLIRLRSLLLALLVCAVPIALGACGVWQGDKEVDTDDGEGALGKGPGLLTGKRGGIIIYQR